MLTVLQGRVEIIFPNIWRLRNINAIENNCRRKQLASKQLRGKNYTVRKWAIITEAAEEPDVNTGL